MDALQSLAGASRSVVWASLLSRKKRLF
jgi:hypothetical protein